MTDRVAQGVKVFPRYKKMAGTAAVFVAANQHANAPVEREGMVWSASELHLDGLVISTENIKPAMANALSLEGLEDYNPAEAGDIRPVTSLGVNMLYVDAIKGWVEVESA